MALCVCRYKIFWSFTLDGASSERPAMDMWYFTVPSGISVRAQVVGSPFFVFSFLAAKWNFQFYFIWGFLQDQNFRIFNSKFETGGIDGHQFKKILLPTSLASRLSDFSTKIDTFSLKKRKIFLKKLKTFPAILRFF